MGYQKIPNLYKNQTILLFKECYAMEKVHGTSAHVSWDMGHLQFSPGGESHEAFLALFDQPRLTAAFQAVFADGGATVYGEAYGGKQQGMRETYGPTLHFIAFEVRVGGQWLSVPNAAAVCESLGLEFMPYTKTTTEIEALDLLRDSPSEVALRRGITESKPREGIVLRPLQEFMLGDERVIAKHKAAAFQERTSQPKVQDAGRQALLDNAAAIADEWVTEMRLTHVLDKLQNPTGIEQTGEVIGAMVSDILTEGEGEFLDTKEARQAISRRAAERYKNRIQKGSHA